MEQIEILSIVSIVSLWVSVYMCIRFARRWGKWPIKLRPEVLICLVPAACWLLYPFIRVEGIVIISSLLTILIVMFQTSRLKDYTRWKAEYGDAEFIDAAGICWNFLSVTIAPAAVCMGCCVEKLGFLLSGIVGLVIIVASVCYVIYNGWRFTRYHKKAKKEEKRNIHISFS